MRRWFSMSAIALAVVFFAACSAKPDALGKNGASAKPYSDLLFIAAYNDATYRVNAETVFTKVLQEKGIEAAPSDKLLPGLENIQNNTEVSETLKSTAYDAILIVSVLAKGYDLDLNNRLSAKGFVYLLDGRPRPPAERGSFLAWAGTGAYKVYAGLWDVQTMRPVWQVTTDAKTTGSDKEDNKALAELIAEQLLKQGLVEPGNKK